MHFIWLVILILLPNASMAGEKGKLVGLLADYADLKQRVHEIQSARKDAYLSDTKEMIALMKEIEAAKQEAWTYHSQLKPGSDESDGNSYAVPPGSQLCSGYNFGFSQPLTTFE